MLAQWCDASRPFFVLSIGVVAASDSQTHLQFYQ